MKKRKDSIKTTRTSKISVKEKPENKTKFPDAGVGTAFKALLSARFCAAIWSFITDCDETFNYWEPLHYLLYGKGLQTWEYSPEFAIRSYTYLLIHGVPAWVYQQIFSPNPMLVFYFVRFLLGVGCATAEVYLYKGICREFGINIGRCWLMFQLFSAGMFISSAALLPSSFSMNFSMAALAAWYQQKYKLAIFFTAISALLGWPFAAIVGIPIVFDMLVRQRKVRLFIIWTVLSGVTILLPMILLDSSYFGKLVIAPLNIVIYNVFTSHGPNLYGVEPFSFYLINGFLNYNIVWPLALITPIALLICYLFVPAKSKSTLSLPYYLSLAPFYLWLAIFMIQPHKEERFLFPIYPMISLCGAITIDVVQKLFFRLKTVFVNLTHTHYLDHTVFITVIFVLLSSSLSLSRILALYRNYHTPLDLMMEFSYPTVEFEEPQNLKEINVCMGKDWYRYPSSFFLPSTKYSIRFIKSEFKGILPAYYSDSENATQIVHNYFNDMNREEEFMLFDYAKCNYLIDLDLKQKKYNTELEPNYSERTKEFAIIKTLPFLNTRDSHQIFRAFYIPFVSERYLVYADFNLMQRIGGNVKSAPQTNERNKNY